MMGQNIARIGQPMAANTTIDPTKSDQLYWEFFSEQQFTESQRNTLVFFQKSVATGDGFENMRRQGSFARGNFFTVFGVSFKLYNTTGAPINYGALVADQASLREFTNRSRVTLTIENKDYMEFPLNNIMNIPTLSQNIAGTAGETPFIGFDKSTNVYRLPKPHQIAEEHSFDVTVDGVVGAFNANHGFSADTRLRCTLHGIWIRPVQ